MGYKSGETADDVGMGEQRWPMKEFNRLLEAMLNESCETGLYKVKFLLVFHVVDDQSGSDVWTFWMYRWLIDLACPENEGMGPHLSNKVRIWWKKLLWIPGSKRAWEGLTAGVPRNSLCKFQKEHIKQTGWYWFAMEGEIDTCFCKALWMEWPWLVDSGLWHIYYWFSFRKRHLKGSFARAKRSPVVDGDVPCMDTLRRVSWYMAMYYTNSRLYSITRSRRGTLSRQKGGFLSLYNLLLVGKE